MFNYASNAVVTVAAPSGLSNGDTYILRNVQDFYGDILTGTVSAASIAVTMTNHTVAAPVGITPAPVSTFPQFGAFVVQKIASATGGTPPTVPLPIIVYVTNNVPFPVYVTLPCTNKVPIVTVTKVSVTKWGKTTTTVTNSTNFQQMVCK